MLPSIPTGLNISYITDHYVLSWNASTPGTFPLGGYRVYRSTTNDGYWKYLGSTTGLTYNDYSASSDSVYYYTISSFDNQTAISASGYATSVMVGNKNISMENYSINVYPNPANDKITIDISSFDETNKTFAELLSVDGKILKSQPLVKSKTQLNVSDLPSGIYILKVTDNKDIIVKRITKK